MDRMEQKDVKNTSNSEINRVTREAIQTALLYLMEVKDFQKITISELVRRAGVSRQAFYRNYDSKEDIIMEIEDSVLRTLGKSMENPKYIHNPYQWFYDLFDFFSQNSKLLSVLIEADLDDLLFSKTPELVEKRFGASEERQHYQIVGYLGAVKSIGTEWYRNGMKESAQLMAEICANFCRLPEHY